MKKIIQITGMHCKHCAAAVEKALAAVEGVRSAKVHLAKNSATVELEGKVADEALQQAVTAAGFQAGDVTESRGLFA